MSNQTRLAERLAFIELDGSAAQRLKGMKEVLTAALPGALDRFYRKMQSEPAARAVLAKPGVLHRTKGRQRAHWDRIAGGRFDHRYLAAVTRVGEAHARIGLEPRWHIGGYAILLEQLVTSILTDRWPKRGFGRRQFNAADVAADMSALIKAVFLDIDLAVAVYLQAVEAARKASEEKVRASAAVTGALRPVLGALAGGDLTHRIHGTLPEPHRLLQQDVNTALDRLHDTVSGVVQNTQGLLSDAGELVQVSDELSRRTARQSAGLHKTAAKLDEITLCARRTAETAADARTGMASVKTEAEASSLGLREAVTAMGMIERSSSEIARIVGLIDQIATQTNILALNAGVEAARAGAAGTGFAVIAAEVRSLARRSAAAAQEIKGLVAESGRAVETGVALVGNTSEGLERIVAEIAHVNRLIEQISATGQEQATSLGEVNATVAAMDQATQETAAMVEQTAAASHSLADDAEGLLRLVRQFRIARPTVAALPPLREVPRPAAPLRETPREVPVMAPTRGRGQWRPFIIYSSDRPGETDR
jgi:methyl-accepting chemotaxis protein